MSAAPKGETLEAYAEWHKGHDLIVDGQRVTTDNRTRFKGKFRNLDSIPLGYEVTVQGTRLPDGRILAQQVEAKANGTALGEPQIRQATDEMEKKWLAAGKVSETDSEGKEQVIGKVVDSGNDYARVQRILARVVPLATWQNGYSRDLEDQADRVGMRYAYEGGYDPNRGPVLWKRFSDKYGSQSSVLNFFMGDHSTAEARIRNLQREIQMNYSGRS
jgi:hypothetical protein